MKLTITVDVDHDIDPARTDPHEIGTDLVDIYNDEIGHGYNAPKVEFVEAEWVES